jgi:hypothetical protein
MPMFENATFKTIILDTTEIDWDWYVRYEGMFKKPNSLWIAQAAVPLHERECRNQLPDLKSLRRSVAPQKAYFYHHHDETDDETFCGVV